MKTIIVPTDYSQTSRNAMEYAAHLAKATQASLLLYHAFIVPVAFSEVPVNLASNEELASENMILLKAMAEQITDLYHVPVACHTSGVPINVELPKLVKHKHASLVVTGRKRAYDWEYQFFGSTVATLIEHAKYPILVIPDEVEFSTPSHILFACDYAVLTRHTPLEVLQELAERFGAEVRVLHIEQAIEDSVNTRVTKPAHAVNLEAILHGIKHHYVYAEDAHVLDGIAQGIREYQADWLVMAPQEHGFWDVVMNKSHTRQMALHSDIPLLVLPQGEL